MQSLQKAPKNFFKGLPDALPAHGLRWAIAPPAQSFPSKILLRYLPECKNAFVRSGDSINYHDHPADCQLFCQTVCLNIFFPSHALFITSVIYLSCMCVCSLYRKYVGSQHLCLNIFIILYIYFSERFRRYFRIVLDLKVLERAEEHCYSAGGWPSSSKGGDAYADYSDIPCVRFYFHIKNYEKKQQPPLGQVTVV